MEQTKLIAKRLKWARENLEITVAEMASVCGISTSEYETLERGGEDFYFSHLYKCAQRLGMDISELVSGADPKLDFYELTRAGVTGQPSADLLLQRLPVYPHWF